jgi:hypothetical protein
MKTTEDVRECVAPQEISEEETLKAGVRQKTKEFRQSGVDVYAKT